MDMVISAHFDDTTGAQITQKGFLKKGTSYYWVREDGVLQTGWLLYDDNWYWFDDNGVMMASGWKRNQQQSVLLPELGRHL